MRSAQGNQRAHGKAGREQVIGRSAKLPVDPDVGDGVRAIRAAMSEPDAAPLDGRLLDGQDFGVEQPWPDARSAHPPGALGMASQVVEALLELAEPVQPARLPRHNHD